ncbi:MAG: L-threonylcarbamoyladenylate synthase [Opitutales bacterium]
MTTTLTAGPAGATRAATLLRSGELVALPTETVYGLAADALSVEACEKIFAVKARPLIDPLIVHVLGLPDIEKLCSDIPTEAAALAKAFWPGPLTLVLPKRSNVPDLVTAGKPSVAVRCPAHPVFREVLAAFGGPLAAPSANPFGYISPTNAEHVLDSLGGRLPAVLDGGPCTHGLESTILSLLERGRPVMLRPGPIGQAELSSVLGIPVSAPKPHSENPISDSQDESTGELAPGMLARHYSPRTPVVLFGGQNEPRPMLYPSPADAWLWQARPTEAALAELVGDHFWLSEDGDAASCARNLFALLRKLDARQPSRILAQVRPQGTGGLDAAINDRLRRAAAR